MKHIVQKVIDDVKHKPFFFLLTIVFDVAFLFVSGFVVGGLSVKASEQLMKIGILAAGQGPQFTDVKQTLFQVVWNNPTLKALAQDMLLYILLAILAFYVLYSLFQGCAWYFATRAAGIRKKVSWAR